MTKSEWQETWRRRSASVKFDVFVRFQILEIVGFLKADSDGRTILEFFIFFNLTTTKSVFVITARVKIKERVRQSACFWLRRMQAYLQFPCCLLIFYMFKELFWLSFWPLSHLCFAFLQISALEYLPGLILAVLDICGKLQNSALQIHKKNNTPQKYWAT